MANQLKFTGKWGRNIQKPVGTHVSRSEEINLIIIAIHLEKTIFLIT